MRHNPTAASAVLKVEFKTTFKSNFSDLASLFVKLALEAS
jgi:hypothetical protein